MAGGAAPRLRSGLLGATRRTMPRSGRRSTNYDSVWMRFAVSTRLRFCANTARTALPRHDLERLLVLLGALRLVVHGTTCGVDFPQFVVAVVRPVGCTTARERRQRQRRVRGHVDRPRWTRRKLLGTHVLHPQRALAGSRSTLMPASAHICRRSRRSSGRASRAWNVMVPVGRASRRRRAWSPRRDRSPRRGRDLVPADRDRPEAGKLASNCLVTDGVGEHPTVGRQHGREPDVGGGERAGLRAEAGVADLQLSAAARHVPQGRVAGDRGEVGRRRRCPPGSRCPRGAR